MEKFIFKNQQIINEKQAQISIHERGFLFGDGIFESVKIFNGKIYDFASHVARIELALKSLKFSAKIDDLEKKSLRLIKKNKIQNGILRISISRGIGSAGYLPKAKIKPLIIIETASERKLPKNIALGNSKIPAGKIPFKSMNSIPYVLNKIQAQEDGFFDLVMLSDGGFISETSSANIFWVKKGKIYTSDESCDIVIGCMRKKLLKHSKLEIIETRKKISALENADEIFLSNSSFLILPVDEFLGRKLEKKTGSQVAKLISEDLNKSCK
jgi:branched-chain amino acid aminotransferase